MKSIDDVIEEIIKVKDFLKQLESKTDDILKFNKTVSTNLQTVQSSINLNTENQTKIRNVITILSNSVDEANKITLELQNKHNKTKEQIDDLQRHKDKIAKVISENITKLNELATKTKHINNVVTKVNERTSDNDMDYKKTMRVTVFCTIFVSVLAALQFLNVFNFFGRFVAWLFK